MAQRVAEELATKRLHRLGGTILRAVAGDVTIEGIFREYRKLLTPDEKQLATLRLADAYSKEQNYIEAARVYLRIGRTDKARKCAERLAKHNLSIYLTAAGRIYEKIGAYEEALSAYKRAAENCGKRREGRDFKICDYRDVMRTSSKLERLREAAQFAWKMSRRYHRANDQYAKNTLATMAGRMFERLHDYKRALECYEFAEDTDRSRAMHKKIAKPTQETQ